MAVSTLALNAGIPSGTPRRRMRLAIAGGRRAPERAREMLMDAASWVPRTLHQPLLLLTCELVSNSVKHGDAGDSDVIGIEVWSTRRGVCVEVSDPGPGFAPAPREQPIDEPGGWGLVLVERMAARWGVLSGARTRVWFELAFGEAG
jgi:two-component sensor histidine kinase